MRTNAQPTTNNNSKESGIIVNLLTNEMIEISFTKEQAETNNLAGATSDGAGSRLRMCYAENIIEREAHQSENK